MPWPTWSRWTRSSHSAAGAGSCFRRRRSTAAWAPRTTTATTASSPRTTSRRDGSRRWCRSVTTSSRSTRRSSSTRRSGTASGHVAGFSDPLVDCRTCKLRFRADHLERCPVRQAAEQEAGRDTGLRPHRGASFQPHVRDAGRPDRGVRLEGLPPPGDCAGHLHQLQERRPARAPQAAVRDRADRQVVPQRDHARQLPLPHARVRADGDGVLRASGRGRPVVPLLDRGARAAGTCASASARATSASARTTRTSSPTTRPARATSSTSSRSAGRSSRGSQTAATSTSPRTPKPPARSSSGSTPGPGSGTCRT